MLYEGRSLAGVSVAERVRRGIAPVLEARRLFPRIALIANATGAANSCGHGGESGLLDEKGAFYPLSLSVRPGRRPKGER